MNGGRASGAAAASKNPVKSAFRLGKSRIFFRLTTFPTSAVQRVWEKAVSVTAYDSYDRPFQFRFQYLEVIGNGTFGIVCRAKDLDTDETVAIKTVYQDEEHQVRERAAIDHRS